MHREQRPEHGRVGVLTRRSRRALRAGRWGGALRAGALLCIVGAIAVTTSRPGEATTADPADASAASSSTTGAATPTSGTGTTPITIPGAAASTSTTGATTTTAGTTTTTAPLVCPITDTFFRVAGTPSIDQAMLGWQTEVCQKNSLNLALDFTQMSDKEARDRLLADDVDVAISPIGFQPYEAGALAAAKSKPSDFIYVPLTASALGCVVNLGYADPNANLYLSPKSLAGISNHVVENLAEPVIDDDNVNNPALPRVPPDDPGPFAGKPVPQRLGDPLVTAGHTNENRLLTQYIYSTPAGKTEWEGKVTLPANLYATGVVDELPSDASVQSVAGPYRIMAEIAIADFGGNGARLGCVDTSILGALGPNRPVAKLQNPLGAYVAPTTDSIQRALAMMPLGTDGLYKPVVAQTDGFSDAAAYSLPIVTYAIVPKNLDAPTRAQAVKLLDWIITKGQQPGRLPAGYVPLPANMTQRAKDEIAAVKALSTPPSTTTTTATTTTTTTVAPPVTDGGSFGGGSDGGGSFGDGSGGVPPVTDTVPPAPVTTAPVTTTAAPSSPPLVARPVVAVLGRLAHGGPAMLVLLAGSVLLLMAAPVSDRIARGRTSGRSPANGTPS